MRKLILIIVLLSANTLLAQKKFKLDPSSFIIGLFNDYNGRQVPLDNPKEATYLTYFYCSQKQVRSVFLDSINKYFNDDDFVFEQRTIYSKSLSKHFNSYYKINKDEDYGTTIDEVDYFYYSMKLKTKSFQTNDKKVSFILGSFILSGAKENGEFQIRMANSASHYDALLAFFKFLKFQYKANELCDTCMPTVQSVSFVPTSEYLSIFINAKIPETNYSDCDKNGL
ncbi:hypothetical protein [Flavobacterium sp.]|uniref:hypothetical protein n=1 Tax=Flavobacterium sp. TaxID=239 RepID=UPI00286D86B8|nr:hypothetical protein [Flavobacterium sp.]